MLVLFPTTSSRSRVARPFDATQLHFPLFFFSVSCFFLTSSSLTSFFAGKKYSVFLKIHSIFCTFSHSGFLVITLQMCFTLLRGGELQHSTTSTTTTSPPRRCRDASLCASRWRMAGILIRQPSLACTCGANVPAGFWRDKLASAGSSFSPPASPLALPRGERPARRSPPAPPDTQGRGAGPKIEAATDRAAGAGAVVASVTVTTLAAAAGAASDIYCLVIHHRAISHF